MTSLNEMEAEAERQMAAAGVPNEAALREMAVPKMSSPDELAAFIASLVDRPHSYGTCVYAMSLSAAAAFHYVAHKLGVTGFQASCADLDILRLTRQFNWGQLLIFDDLLYPQYRDKFPTWDGLLAEHKGRLAERAKELLAKSGDTAHPSVVAHWRALAANG